MKRTHNQLRRILLLIDVLSNLRMPFTLQEAISLFEEKHGSKMKACDRTILRDLQLLVDMNYACVYRKYKPLGRGTEAGFLPTQYKMNLSASNLQRAAAKAGSD